MKHKHADLMKQYAEDWAETYAPWKRWECDADGWLPLKDHPYWLSDVKYRRKPRTININGFEVPEPVREPLEEGQLYYVPIIGSEFMRLDCRLWNHNDYCTHVLKAGLIHRTQEAAELHRKALLSFTEARE